MKKFTIRDCRFLGRFSKAIPGSVSLNFGRSAGRNCPRSCRYHSKSTNKHAVGGCYAEVLEKRPDRRNLARKLDRLESMAPRTIITAALWELKRLIDANQAPPWFRFCTAGSMPRGRQITPAFVAALRQLLIMCEQHTIPVHLPVASPSTAATYRSAIGDLVVIRESVQTPLHVGLSIPGPVSFVVGSDISGVDIRERRISAATQAAKLRTETSSRKCIVCPAVVDSFRSRTARKPKNTRALCGSCCACALPHMDVIYPHH